MNVLSFLTLGYFNGTFETCEWFEIIPYVVECKKINGLLGIDVLKVDMSKLIRNVKSEKVKMEVLKGYKASIPLNENGPQLLFRIS